MPYSVPTCNRMGYIACGLDEPSRAFVAFAATCRLPVLDVGAGYGLATAAALDAGAPTAVALDLDGRHLAMLHKLAAPSERARLTLRVARFPDEVAFPADSFGAIHASRVCHFLTADEMETGFARMAEWLAPGGKLFLHALTPYAQACPGFAPVFAARKRAGELWPGVIANVGDYDRPHDDSHSPPMLHVFDSAVLAAGARRAGLIVERSRMFTPARYPPELRHDGRETVGLVARKRARK